MNEYYNEFIEFVKNFKYNLGNREKWLGYLEILKIKLENKCKKLRPKDISIDDDSELKQIPSVKKFLSFGYESNDGIPLIGLHFNENKEYGGLVVWLSGNKSRLFGNSDDEKNKNKKELLEMFKERIKKNWQEYEDEYNVSFKSKTIKHDQLELNDYPVIKLEELNSFEKLAELICDLYEDFMHVLDQEYKPREGGKKYSSERIALNTILYGPPGTGKTYNTMSWAEKIIKDKDNK